MSTRHRRIIRRPEGVEDSAWSRLADLLAAAVEQQRRLAAQSPNVLGPRSGLDTLEDGSLSFAHEPAEPSAIAALFDSRAAKAAPEMLLRWTAEVFSALSAAHGPRPGERPVSHGGICPGTILTTPGGQAKVTDFGFAPAFCQALGADAYVNLAIAPPSEPGCPQPGPIRQSRARKEAVPPSEPGCPQPGPTESQSRSAQPGFDDPITGIWEVLDPHTFDRDDRICGFIDPEKYGSRALGTFESGSDVIAAGFVLHLMAEHQHPYLYTDPDAHRLVEMSQFMGMGRFNGARRQDLRESTDPAVRLWCDLIAKTLSRLPKNRPTAAEIVQALSGEAGADQVAAVLKREAVLPKPPASRPPSEPASERPRETRREAAVEPVDATSFRAAPVRKRVLAIVVTLVVAIGAIGAWQFWPGGQAEQTSRVSANDNLSPPAPPIDRRLVENDAPEKPDDGPPDNTVVTPPAENENTSTPDEVVPIPANANQDPSPDAALVEGGEALTRRVVRLEERLDGATHEALSDIIARRSIDSLEKEVRAYWDRAHAAGAEEQSKIARGQATRLGDWMRKIASYERILIMADKPLDEQIRLLEAAQEDWSTPHVEKLLNGLPAVDNLLGEADRLLGRGEWRRARFAITQAADKAIEQNLGDLLSPVITAARAKLARDRRDQLADAFRDAAEWLALIEEHARPFRPRFSNRRRPIRSGGQGGRTRPPPLDRTDRRGTGHTPASYRLDDVRLAGG
jgi:serine/threonine protein kinase